MVLSFSDAASTQDNIEYQFNRPSPASADLSVQVNLDTKKLCELCECSHFTISNGAEAGLPLMLHSRQDPALQSLPGSTEQSPTRLLPDHGNTCGILGTELRLRRRMLHSATLWNVRHVCDSLRVMSGGCVETASHAITIEANTAYRRFYLCPLQAAARFMVKFTNLSKFADPSSTSGIWKRGGDLQRNRPHVHLLPAGDVNSVNVIASNITGQT